MHRPVDYSVYEKASYEKLAFMASQNDMKAFSFLQISKLNERYKIGDVVLYLKSEVEGVTQITVASKAYVSGEGMLPVVDLDVIGTALLSKVKPAMER